jgi:5-hydroxyisourate hydrolase
LTPPERTTPIAEEIQMGQLTTHMLDTVSGKPAAGVRIDLSILDGDRYRLIKTVHTNADGRTDGPLLAADMFTPGGYELVFHVAEHFAKQGVHQASPPFLDQIPLRFAIADAAAHYHVPLLATPWSYSTYRGS